MFTSGYILIPVDTTALCQKKRLSLTEFQSKNLTFLYNAGAK